jgi:Zn-dependent protease
MDTLFPTLQWTNLLIIPGLLIGYTVHELAHALAAYFLGDTSQVERGRFTLNPFEHMSWFGSLSFLLFGVGWAKPIQVNPQKFKRKYLDIFLVAMAGPLASLTLSVLGLLITLMVASVLVYATQTTTDHIFSLLFPVAANMPQTLDIRALALSVTLYVSTASFWLTFTSLLPLPGLDGFTALASLAAHLRQQRQSVRPKANLKPVRQTPLTQADMQERRNATATIHFNIGVEFHQDQKYNDAIVRYRQAIDNDRHFGPAYINMGLAFLAKGRRKEAIHAFRGAIQFADDHKTQSEAWQQLHHLSEVSPVDEAAAKENMAQLGASPWTNTRPTPNWLALGLGAAILVVSSLAMYSYLISEMILFLQK